MRDLRACRTRNSKAQRQWQEMKISSENSGERTCNNNHCCGPTTREMVPNPGKCSLPRKCPDRSWPPQICQNLSEFRTQLFFFLVQISKMQSRHRQLLLILLISISLFCYRTKEEAAIMDVVPKKSIPMGKCASPRNIQSLQVGALYLRFKIRFYGRRDWATRWRNRSSCRFLG